MKKILLAAAFAVLALPSFAGIDQGIDAGMTHLSLYGGFAAPLSEYDPSGTSATMEYGDSGPSYGVQIMNYLTPHFGLGAEFNATNYLEAHGLFFTNRYSSKADRYAFMLAGKVVFAPEAKTRVYLPLGAGFSRFKATITNEGTGVSASESFTKPSFYAGLGVESDLNDIFIFGLEGRYNWFATDKDKIDMQSSFLDDMSLLLKLGIKF